MGGCDNLCVSLSLSLSLSSPIPLLEAQQIRQALGWRGVAWPAMALARGAHHLQV